MLLPKVKTENIVIQELDKELLIYDLMTHKAYTLNETSRTIYVACGIKLTFEELKSKHKFTDDLIYLAIDEFKRNNLLAEEYNFPLMNLNRREIIRRAGLSTMTALPIITALVAPKAVQALSCVPYGETGCLTVAACCGGGTCISGTCCSPTSSGALTVGTQTSGALVSFSQTCAVVTLTANATCRSARGHQCCNGNAVYAGDCYDPVGPSRSAFTCRCA